MKESNISDFYREMGISEPVLRFGEQVLKELKGRFEEIDETAEYNQLKVLKAMQENKVSEACLLGTTGYGYNDLGRETLESVYAAVFHTQDALVRPQITCGTHALALALMSNLRPGDELLSPVGKPYDTLEEVIGIRESRGSLKEYGISYRQVDLLPDGGFDYENIEKALNERTRLVTIQRSKGYQTRPTLSVKRIGELIAFIKSRKPDCICMVDNCYGEFVERDEPLTHGADIMAGSLIKNPGGGIAPTGGYIAGRKDLVELCSYRLTTPGTGREIGCTLGNNRELFLGAFHAPHVTGEALKTAVFASALFSELGFDVTPRFDEPRADIIQVVMLREKAALVAFCKGVQKGAPVDSFVVPEPSPMPGYDSDVIMAAGAFTLGASIELSADAPLREPYAAWMQGGLNYHSGQLGMLLAAQEMLEEKLV